MWWTARRESLGHVLVWGATFTCSVLVLQGHDEEREAIWRRLVARGVPVKALRARKTGVTPSLVPRIARALRAFEADVVHAHNLQPLLYAGLAARLRPGTPVVSTAHGWRNWDDFRFDKALRAVLPRNVQKDPESSLARRARYRFLQLGVALHQQGEALLPVADVKQVEERRDGLGAEGHGAPTHDQRVSFGAVFGAEGDARQVQHHEDVRVTHLELEREADHVERAQCQVGHVLRSRLYGHNCFDGRNES